MNLQMKIAFRRAPNYSVLCAARLFHGICFRANSPLLECLSAASRKTQYRWTRFIFSTIRGFLTPTEYNQRIVSLIRWGSEARFEEKRRATFRKFLSEFSFNCGTKFFVRFQSIYATRSKKVRRRGKLVGIYVENKKKGTSPGSNKSQFSREILLYYEKASNADRVVSSCHTLLARMNARRIGLWVVRNIGQWWCI